VLHLLQQLPLGQLLQQQHTLQLRLKLHLNSLLPVIIILPLLLLKPAHLLLHPQIHLFLPTIQEILTLEVFFINLQEEIA